MYCPDKGLEENYKQQLSYPHIPVKINESNRFTKGKGHLWGKLVRPYLPKS